MSGHQVKWCQNCQDFLTPWHNCERHKPTMSTPPTITDTQRLDWLAHTGNRILGWKIDWSQKGDLGLQLRQSFHESSSVRAAIDAAILATPQAAPNLAAPGRTAIEPGSPSEAAGTETAATSEEPQGASLHRPLGERKNTETEGRTTSGAVCCEECFAPGAAITTPGADTKGGSVTAGAEVTEEDRKFAEKVGDLLATHLNRLLRGETSFALDLARWVAGYRHTSSQAAIECHSAPIKAFLEELAEYLGLEGRLKPQNYIKAALDIRQKMADEPERTKAEVKRATEELNQRLDECAAHAVKRNGETDAAMLELSAVIAAQSAALAKAREALEPIAEHAPLGDIGWRGNRRGLVGQLRVGHVLAAESALAAIDAATKGSQ